VLSGGVGVDTTQFDPVTQNVSLLYAQKYDSSGFGVVNYQTYGYDNANNATSIVDYASYGVVDQTRCFTYDSLSRLDHAFTGDAACTAPDMVSGPAPFDRTYGYDEIGNLVSKTGTGTLTYSAVHPHAVASTSSGDAYAYDSDANMTLRTPAGGTDSHWASWRLVSLDFNHWLVGLGGGVGGLELGG